MSKTDTTGDPREHAIADESKIEQARRELVWLLRGRTREEAISSAALAEQMPVSASTVRDLVPEVRAELGIPLVSGSGGYYEVQDHDDFLRVMDREQATIERKRERMRDLSAAWNTRRYGGRHE